MYSARWALSASALALVVFSTEANAGASEPASPSSAATPAPAPAPPRAAAAAASYSLGSPFIYTTPASRHYWRALLEDVLVLGLGYAQYASNKAGNEADWDLAPDWSSVESKVTLSSLTFDNNHFDTNWLTHPGAGFLYYSAVRSNRISIPVSLLYTVVSSTLWEYFGELREHAAINDLIATPMTGLPLGESMLHLGAFFERGSQASPALSWLFAPLKKTHDLIDGLDPAPTTTESPDVWHRFTLGTSVGFTRQRAGLAQGDVRAYASSRIIEVAGYDSAGSQHGFFTDGEVSEISVRAAVSESELVDIGFEARSIPWGYATQDVTLDANGNKRGFGLIAGLGFGAEYGRHDYDRDRRRAADRIALVALGPMFEERAHLGAWTLRARLDGFADFAGVDSYALPEEAQTYGDIHLASVLRNEHYYHAYGVTLHPSLTLEHANHFDVGGELRTDWFTMIAHRDVDPTSTNERIQASDRRILSRAWIGLHPARHLRVSVMGELQDREGRVGASRAGRSEVGAHLAFEALF